MALCIQITAKYASICNYTFEKQHAPSWNILEQWKAPTPYLNSLHRFALKQEVRVRSRVNAMKIEDHIIFDFILKFVTWIHMIATLKCMIWGWAAYSRPADDDEHFPAGANHAAGGEDRILGQTSLERRGGGGARQSPFSSAVSNSYVSFSVRFLFRTFLDSSYFARKRWYES